MYKNWISAKVRSGVLRAFSLSGRRGPFDLTPLGKRHLRRSGSHLLSHFANHKLDLSVERGTFLLKTFGHAYSLLLSTHPIDFSENGNNFKQYACIVGFYEGKRAVIPLLPEKENLSLCTLCNPGK